MPNLNCPQCNSPIAAADINEPARLAKCSRCGEVFSFPSPLSTPARNPVSMPGSITVRQVGNDLLITRRWYHWQGLLFFIIGLVALPVIAFAAYSVLTTVTENYRFIVLLLLLLPITFLYYGLCQLMNRTEIRVNSQQIDVQHIPLPASRHRIFQTSTIDQLYRSMQIDSSEHGSQITFTVEMVLKGGDRQLLLSGLRTREETAFIEQKIERHLGIVDRPVVGEDRR